MLLIIEFIEILLPVPVAPAINKCGIFARSVTTGLPKISFPKTIVSFGVDLRVLRLLRLRAEGGGDRILGSDALMGNLRLSALDFLHTGLDVLAGYRIRSRKDSMREIYSITVSRSIGRRVTVEGDFSQLQYRFDRVINEYHTQSVGLNVSYLLYRSIDISLDVESTRHEGDLRDVRVFAGVGYALGGYRGSQLY